MVNGIKYLHETEPYFVSGRNMRMAAFECKCGNIFIAIIRSIVTGNTTSCGCYGIESRKKRFTKHGKRSHKLYSIWSGIKTRCNNKNRDDYKYYGGRGIYMSDEFSNNFETWFNYVIKLPNYENRDRLKLTVDRVDNNKNYERGNLRWATRQQQTENRNLGS